MSNAMQLEHGDYELRLGDCLDPVTGLASLADGCVDHVLSDPPYEAEAHTLQRRVKRGPMGVAVPEPLEFAQISEFDRSAIAAHAGRLASQGAVIFCQAEAVTLWRDALDAAGLPYRRALVWIKPDAMPSLHGRWPGQAFESIVLARMPSARACPIGGKSKVYEMSKADGIAVHPTQKPLALMEALVRDFTDPGDLILDPFAGSGTTGVACRRLGRRFLGWERDPKFHAAAMKRIGAAREQLGLLSRAKAPKVEQGDMFKAAAKVRS